MRFVLGIVRKVAFETTNPKCPWLTEEAVRFLAKWIKPKDVLFEFGSGQSTDWFASRVGRVVSVEHDREWYKTVDRELQKHGNKIDYRLAKSKKEYVGSVGSVPDNSVDICLVDGEWRMDCALAVLPKIKPGGLLILDNAETYFPLGWKSNSFQTLWEQRGCLDKKVTLTVQAKLREWRMLATSDVVQDTVFWIKNYE